MITIHDRRMTTVARGPAQDILPARSALVPLEHLDLYPTTPEGPCMLGASWSDGSSGICDWLHGGHCRMWLAEAAQTWAKGRIRVHIKVGRAVQTADFGDLMSGGQS